MRQRERLARTAEDRRSGGEATAPAPALLQLQRTAGNHAVVRTLARQDHPEGAAPLARPGEQPLHQQQFDAFVAAVCANSDPAALEAARTACDGPAQSGEQTLEHGGRKLI